MKVFFYISITVLVIPLVSFAGDYLPMARLPLVDYGNLSIEEYLNALYLLSISVAAILAVLKITLAGVKYVMSDIVTQKGDAKKDIQGALFGLLIVLAAFIILNTINRDLTVFAILAGVSDEIVASDRTPRFEANKAATAARQEGIASSTIAEGNNQRAARAAQYAECLRIGEIMVQNNATGALSCTDNRIVTEGTDVATEIEANQQEGDFTIDNSPLDGIGDADVPDGGSGGGGETDGEGGGGGEEPTTCRASYTTSITFPSCLPRDGCNYRQEPDSCIDINDNQQRCTCVLIPT